MYCPNCGNEISTNDRYCPNCGNSLLQNNNINNTTTSYEDDELLKAYIGNNYESISSGRFNIPAFLLTGIYLLYRKCYLYFFLLILALMFFPYLFLITCLVFGFCFNKWYIKKANQDIQNIKASHPNSTTSELLDLVTKKGGTSMAGPIIYLTLFFIACVLFVLMLYFLVDKVEDIRKWSIFDDGIIDNYFDEDIGTDYYDGYSEGIIYDLHYYVPYNYAKIDYKEDIEASYQYRYNESICKFKIYVVTNEIDNSINSFQRGTPPKEENINNQTYNYIEYNENNSINFIYYTKHYGYLYVLEFEDNNDINEKCSQGREELFNNIIYNMAVAGESPDYA